MKKLLTRALAASVVLSTFFAPSSTILAANATPPVPAESSAEETPSLTGASSAKPMYRLYNKNSGEHFYTASSTEKDHLAKIGWADEGIGWYAPASSSIPVYRLYNPNGGEHYYTTKKAERDSLIKGGWRDEKIGWYSDPGKQVPLYQQYNPHAFANNHNYTTSKAENDQLVRIGWKPEGVGWYGVNTPKTTFEQDSNYATIEANLNLAGSGTGYHGKLVIAGGGSTISFGIQYFQNMHYNPAVAAQAGSTDAVFLLENVMSHATEAGTTGKHYKYISNARTNTNYKIRLSWNMSDNMIHCFVNDIEIYSEKTTLSGPLQFAVEGSCAHNGDTINAQFTNVRIACGDGRHNYRSDHNGNDYGTIGTWNANDANYFGLRASVVDPGQEINTPGRTQTFYSPDNGTTIQSWKAYNAKINITGTAQIDPNYDWDTCFQITDRISGKSGVPLSGQATIAQQQV